ncbi:hypothetical protein D3C78_1690870 [compost metagenome]
MQETTTITSCRIDYKKKDDHYILTTTHKRGSWEGSATGAKIYPIDGMLVHTQWGSGKPIKIYKNEQEMIDFLSSQYSCQVVLNK